MSLAISGIAISGLQAAETQTAVTADNTADSTVTGAPPATSAPFGSSDVAAPPVTGSQPSAPAGVTTLQAVNTALPGGGVAASVQHSAAFNLSYQPDSPNADAQGLVATPNVNPVQQSVELASASNAFLANLQTLSVSNSLTQRILDITT